MASRSIVVRRIGTLRPNSSRSEPSVSSSEAASCSPTPRGNRMTGRGTNPAFALMVKNGRCISTTRHSRSPQRSVDQHATRADFGRSGSAGRGCDSCQWGMSENISEQGFRHIFYPPGLSVQSPPREWEGIVRATCSGGIACLHVRKQVVSDGLTGDRIRRSLGERSRNRCCLLPPFCRGTGHQA